MLRINCPWCGERDELEFSYGGQAHLAYPGDPHALSDEQWGQYLFMRDNPKGLFRERWVHSQGCRRWFNIERHTVSHEIVAVYKVGEHPPADSGEQG
jgi:heterotetrameric sarcosine oxidase delta subunit